MTTVHDLESAMQLIAFQAYAAEWDNVGLLAGSSSWPLNKIMLTIDLTQEVLDEAREVGAEAIVAYHPPIFEPLKTLTDRDEKSRLVMEAIHAGIALYSPHTALDAVPGGVNDWLAEAFGESASEPLKPNELIPWGERRKIVTIVPAEFVDSVSEAMANAGAGHIGFYTHCSFRITGQGTFIARDEATPFVGGKNKLETVDEVRLEMVSSHPCLGKVIQALRLAHPYEEPPVEVYQLLPRPQADSGEGRLLRLNQSCSLEDIIDRLKTHLNIDHLKVAIGRNAPATYEVIGLCPGAGGSLLENAIQEEAQLYLTGEMRHHEVLDAIARGCTIILAGHTNTERGYLPRLAKRLGEIMNETTIMISKADQSPFEVR
ncbi:MAG: Nif3-like dinuclear metal center hexameric protein [Planctomycetota bacterium]|nr:Nif3-like dinuclear metal center hexameric protein [Planctomycetota bacterium]